MAQDDMSVKEYEEIYMNIEDLIYRGLLHKLQEDVI